MFRMRILSTTGILVFTGGLMAQGPQSTGYTITSALTGPDPTDHDRLSERFPVDVKRATYRSNLPAKSGWWGKHGDVGGGRPARTRAMPT